jgi:cytochrome c peroxidase
MFSLYRRKKFTRITLVTSVVAATALIGVCVAQSGRLNEPIQALPLGVTDVDLLKVKLGEKLFADKRLSVDGTVSCQSCHLPEFGGADPHRHSVSANGVVRPMNSPSIYNLRYNTSGLNWTGRTASLEKQIEGSISNKDTMAHSWPAVIEWMAKDTAMVKEFAAAFGGDNAVSQKNAMDAIVSFERSLVTPSRFDDYLRGDDNAITAEAKRGYDLFKSNGCTACHNGINVGGNSYFKMGLVADYFAAREKAGRGAVNELDQGKFLQSKVETDRHVFRTAPLRNVELTAPYFHDGSVATLDEAVQLMARHQLGKELPADERKFIASFLRSLTGKELEKYRAK